MIEIAETTPVAPEAPAALPLSSGQQRLWFLHRMDPLSPAYNMAGGYRLRGDLDLPALARAFGEIVRRHEVLRTVYALWGEEPVQVVQPPVPVSLPLVDLSSLPPGARESEAERVAFVEGGRPFALDFPLDAALEGALDPRLAPPPVLRAAVVRLEERDHLVLVTVHHIACDGWSIGVLLRELGALYGAFTAGRPSPLPEPPIQYADFAIWQREHAASGALDGQLDSWRERLAGAPPALELPTDRPRPPVRGLRGGEVPVRIPADRVEALARLGRGQGATLFQVLMAAFQALLHRETEADDLSVGTPVSGRGQSETEGLIGFFVNTLVIRTDLGGRPSFRELIARVRDTAVEAYAHQELPFERLVEALVSQHDPSRTPLFQTFFALQEWAPDPAALPGLEMATVRIPADTAKFDLSLSLFAGPAGLSGVVEYSAELFDRTTAQRIASRFERLVREAMADPEASLDALPLLGEVERHQTLVEWGADTRRDLPRERGLHELFEDQARRNPDAPALSGWTGERFTRLTYIELDDRADRLARRLQDGGVGPEDLVAVLLERSPALVVTLLAVLKAGGAYVPLDPTYPVERLDFLLRDSGARTLVTASAGALPDGLEIGPGVRIVALGGEEGDPSQEAPRRFGGADRLAYVIYTSGSTGRPKGVAMPHRGVARLALGTAGYAPLGPGDRMAQAANASFDAAAFEIWSALLNGAELVVLPAHRMSLEELGGHLERERITVFCPTASLFNQMVDGPIAKLAGVGRILTGGEVVSSGHVRKLLAAFPEGPRVVCCYGPTENTTFTSVHPVESAERVRSPMPIGRPLPNTRVHLLDRERRPVPAGVAGELCAGGDGLARGYLGRPDLTAERFGPDPLGEPGARLYHTGDRARWRPDGTLDFLGRLDGQIKLRGFRIEPGEIEAALTAHPAVEQAVVLPRTDGPAGLRLAAFLVPSPGAARDSSEVRAFLRGRLPEHLVPSALVWLDALPLTEHGKADRRALARMDVRTEPVERDRSRTAGPRDPIEEGLAGIWRDVLGTIEDAGPEDDFFELGGHSLLATQVASRIREAFGVELPLRDLFAAPRLAGLAARIAEERARQDGGEAPAAGPAVSPIPAVSREGRAAGLPLTFGQEWMWIADQLDPEAAVHNAPISVLLRGALDLGALEAALRQIVRRHETLHLRFVVKEGVPRLIPSPEIPLPFQVIDVSALPEERRVPEARRAASAEGARPFDLAAGLPVRALVARLGPEEHVLLLGLHHLVIDGWSFGLLLREIPVFYVAFRTGTPPDLPALPFQYGDYAVWQREQLSGAALQGVLGWWREHLSPAPPPLELPADRPRAAQGLALGERLFFRLDPERTDALRAVARRRGSTLFAILLAAFEALLARLSGQDDLVVAAPFANRTRRDMEGLIGYFANDLPLRTRVGGDPPFPELLDRVHETALGAWAHQSLPLSRILQETGDAAPGVRAYFQLLNTPMPDFALAGLTLTPFDLEARIATFDLAMITREVEGGIDGQLIASRELFVTTSAQALLRGFLVLVEGILDDPDRRLSELPLLAPEERHALLHEWNPIEACPGATPLHRAFERVAADRPDAPAVTFEGVTLTYGELDRRSEELARNLRARGIGPESRVGLRLERSPELVVGILGILKAGGAYVPLDPDYPRERLDLLVEDARLDALVTEGGALSRAAGEGRGGGVSAPDHLAYVIYTSGSTGRPKGVMVTHRQAARLFEATRRFGFGPDDVWTLFHSFAFDFSVWELWGALLHGGRLVIVPRWVARSPEAFLDLLADEGVTVLNQTPSAFYELARAEEARGESRPLALRWVLFGGEALEPPKLRAWMDRHGDARPALVNLYGITETTVHATLRPLTRADLRSSASVLGRPLDDLRIHLVDPRLDLVPAVGVGEIAVGGGGVARGYLGRPELTAERFVPDPFSGEPGARLYRSGDLARRRPDGELEYRGRADQQLKVRGFRIEPGEVEAALVRHPAVAQAAVIARRFGDGDVRLVACVVPRGAEPSSAELRDHLLAALPEPWVPSHFVAVPALPLTAHGKVDRRALAELAVTTGAATPSAVPLSPLEEILARLWADLLEVESVGRDDNFFALGGHSLLITRVAARIRKDFGATLPMRSFFDRPTVANLSAALFGELAARVGEGRMAELVARVQGMTEGEVGRMLEERRALLGTPSPTLPRSAGEGAPSLPVNAESVSAARVEGALSRASARGRVGEGVSSLRLAHIGESARVRDLLAVLPPAAPTPPLQVTTLAVPTCNRPAVLERGIASHAEVARERGRALRFAVLDDSPDPAVRREYRERLAALGRRYGAEIVYAGQEEKRRFRAALEAEGIPPAAVAATLTDLEGVGVPVGANRNCVLLQTVGEGALSIDDDTLARGGPPPETASGVAFLSGTAPGTAFLSGRDPGRIHGFTRREEALAAVALRPVDLPGIHEELLGRELSGWLGGIDPDAPAALDSGDPGFLRSLEAAGGRVRVTTNGWAGDCGWRSPTFYMLLGGDSWRRLTTSAAGYRAVTASKEIVRFVSRPTVGNGDSFMATLYTGLDNREILPPFPPVLWGEDLLFGVTLQLAFPAARVGHLPWVATHEPMEERAFWPGEMVRSASGIDHSRLVSALLADFEPDPAAPPAAALRRLGAFFQDLGRMPAADFDERARRAVGARAAVFAAELEGRLAAHDLALEGAGPWAEDVRRYLDLLRRHAAEPEFAVPLDLLYGREPAEAMRLAQRLISNHGVVLASWPDLVEATRSLKARGQGLGEAVR